MSFQVGETVDLSVVRGDGTRVFRYNKLVWPRASALESWAIKLKKYAAGKARWVQP